MVEGRSVERGTASQDYGDSDLYAGQLRPTTDSDNVASERPTIGDGPKKKV
jgi:hypothetical protein